MPEVKCPTLQNILAGTDCMEDFGGLGSIVYVFVKSDLKAPLTRNDNEWSTPEFKEGKGLYKFECKEDSQGIVGSSQGYRGGFKQQLDFVLEAVNKDSSKVARALNNLDCGYIVKDGEVSQIVYHPDRKFVYDADGISADTGKAPEDDRQVNLSGTLKNVFYPNMFVKEPEEGWDSMLASAVQASEPGE